MKLSSIAILALSFLFLSSGQALADDALTIGDQLVKTDVAMKGVSGESTTIAKAAGEKGTLVVFTCNHCPYVKAWEERIAEVGNDALTKDVGVIAINSNDPEKYPEDDMGEMKKRAKKFGLKFPYVVDSTSDVARAYGAAKTPEFFLFDADGKLVYHGALDDNAEDPEKVEKTWLADAINALAEGKEIEVATTKALGCSIKFR